MRVDAPVSAPAPDVPTADRDRARTVVQAWLDWYTNLSAEPATDAPATWVTERMEYEFPCPP